MPFCLPLEGVTAGGGWIKHKLELYPPPALRATPSQTEVWEGLKAPPLEDNITTPSLPFYGIRYTQDNQDIVSR